MKNLSSITYRKDIDGLRALAVLLVLVFHFNLAPFGKGGFLGVDIFFVISGFLITSILVKELNTDSFRFGHFYAKRIRRLAPALFTTLALVMVAGSIFFLPEAFRELSKQVLTTQFYVSNFYFWQNINYFGIHADATPLLHTWSLAVEEQFYLLFPIFVVILYKYLRPFFWPAIISGLLISFCLNIIFVHEKPELTFYLMPTRAWEMLLGSVAMLISSKLTIRSAVINEIIAISGLGIITLSVFLYSVEVVFPGYYALAPTFGAMMIIISGKNESTSLSRLLGLPIIVYIGKLSYSLYLTHWPIHIFASSLLGVDGYTMTWRLAMFGLTFIVSIAILHLIETPIRKGKFLYSDKRIYSAYLAGLLTTILVCGFVLYDRGVPSRFSPETIKMAEYVLDKPPVSGCQYNGQQRLVSDDFCLIGDAEIPPSWIVIGDSHAWAGQEAFNLYLKSKGESGFLMFQHNCPPLKGLAIFKAKGSCMAFNNASYDFMSQFKGELNVLLVSTWIQAGKGSFSYDPNIKLSPEESIDYFNKVLHESINYINKLDNKLYVWGPLPGAKKDVPNTLARAKNKTAEEDQISFTLAEHLNDYAFFYTALKKHKEDIYGSFLPFEVLCVETEKCRVTQDGKPLYFDGSHMSLSSSAFWAKFLIRLENDNDR